MTNTLNTAFLSNKGEYTFFKFRDRVITFLTGKRLERLTIKSQEVGKKKFPYR